MIWGIPWKWFYSKSLQIHASCILNLRKDISRFLDSSISFYLIKTTFTIFLRAFLSSLFFYFILYILYFFFFFINLSSASSLYARSSNKDVYTYTKIFFSICFHVWVYPSGCSQLGFFFLHNCLYLQVLVFRGWILNLKSMKCPWVYRV